jgi:hypothetical protein
MVDNQTSLLISSVVINVLLIVERIMSKMKRSKCCNSEIEMNTSKSSIDLNNIKISDNNSNEVSTNV